MRTRLLASTFLTLGITWMMPTLAMAQATAPAQTPTSGTTPNPSVGQTPGAPATPAAQAPQDGDADAAQLDEVIVTGFRSSLERSLELKRDAITFRDSIVAEDIGKFPEQNIADALVRLPGVELVKDAGSNEGQNIRLRGLDSQFTVTTFNGSPVYTTSGAGIGNASRSFNYDVFASELFGRADIYKAPLAELTEGGIAGVVDLQTQRPFDRAGFNARYSTAGAYNTQSGEIDPRGSFVLSNTWNDRWGILVAGAASRATNGFATFQSTGTYSGARAGNLNGNPIGNSFDYNFTSPLVNLNGLTQAQVNNAILPRTLLVGGRENVRERQGLSTSLQYRDDRLEVSLDTLYSKVTDDGEQRDIRWPVRDSVNALSLIPINVRIDENNNLQGTLGNVQFFYQSQFSQSETEYLYNALNASYSFSDTLKVSGQIGTSRSEAFRNDITLAGDARQNRQTITFDTTDPVAPTITTTSNLLDTSTYSTNAGVTYSGGYRTEIDEQNSARFVLDWDYQFLGIAGHLKAGASYNENTKDLQVRSTANLLNSLTIPGGGLYSASTTAQRNAYTNSLLQEFDLKEFLPGSPSSFPTRWLVLPREFAYETLGAVAANQSAAFNLGSTYIATETITSAFIQSDYDTELFGRRLRANSGLRYVKTETDINNNVLVGSAFVANNRQGDYDDWLPSATIAYDLRHDLVFRAAYGKTLTRAAIQSIAASISLPAGGAGNLRLNAGNPELRPEHSTSYDASLEWFFQRGGILSFATYKKEITDRAFTTSTFIPSSIFSTNLQADLAADPTTLIEIVTPQNQNEFSVKGIEIAYQQNFTFLPAPFDGFGTIVSWTNVETVDLFRTYNGTNYPLVLVPQNTYAITGFYEKGPFALRASYNYKTESANVGQTSTNVIGFQRWANARGYLDASISYKINPLFEIRLDGTNLTNTLTYDFFRNFEGLYGDEESRVEGANQNGSYVTLSVRGRF